MKAAVMWRRSHAGLLALSILLSVTACSPTERRVSEDPLAIAPKNLPVRNVTGFDDALQCMDDVLAILKPKKILLMAEKLPNESGVQEGIVAGIKQMLITAVSEMAARSDAVGILGIDTTNRTKFVEELSVLKVKQVKAASGKVAFSVPDYVITGGITQVEKDAIKGGTDLKVGIGDYVGIGVSDTKSVSAIALNLGLADLASYQALRGITSDNVIAVVKNDDGVSLKGGMINYGSIGFAMHFRQNEGMSAAVRSLVQLGVIELVGKYFGIPYRDCFQAETKTKVLTWAQEKSAKQVAVGTSSQAALASLSVSALHKTGVFRPGERVDIAVTSSDSGFLYCFYAMKDRKLVKVFPNVYSQNNEVTVGAAVTVPGDRNVEITAERSSPPESIDCLFSRRDITRQMPGTFQGNSLIPHVGETIDSILSSVAGQGVANVRFPIRTQ